METLERQDLKKALSGKRIGRLTKRDIANLRKEINQKLESLELTYGVQLRLRNIRYDGVSFRGKLEGELLSPAGGESVEAIHFKENCYRFGLKTEDYNREITLPPHSKFANMKGKITGVNTKAKKYPIIITLSNGSHIKYSYIFIKDLLK